MSNQIFFFVSRRHLLFQQAILRQDFENNRRISVDKAENLIEEGERMILDVTYPLRCKYCINDNLIRRI